MNWQSSEALLQKARRGDQAALGCLFESIRPRLAGVVRKALGPKLRETVEIDDVVQETFACAVESARKCRAENEDAFVRWLGAIAQNLIRKSARRRERDPVLYIDREAAASGISPSREMRRDERFRRLQRAFATLTPEQREVVRLVRLDGLKIGEVAQRIGKTPGSVKQLMLRALRSLRSRLSETESLNLPDLRLDGELAHDVGRQRSDGPVASD